MTAFLEHLSYGFFQHALAACLIIGAVCAVFSTYVVLRRLVFAGVALTQLSSAGLGLAALFGLPALPVSLATTVLGIGLLALVRPGQKGRTDNLVALLYIGGWAASVLLFAVAERGDTELAAVLYGDILGVLASDIYAFAPVALLVVALMLALGKELLFVSFDPETAATCRIPVWLYDTVLFAGLGIIIVFATKMLGLLLVFAFLVAPGTAALMVCRRMGPATVFAVAFAIVMSLAGLAAAASWDLPPGPAVTAAGLVLLGLLWAARGLSMTLGRGRAPSMRVESDTLRTASVVTALAVIAAVAGVLSTRVASERTSGLLHEHGHAAGMSALQPTAPAEPAAASATPSTAESEYANRIGDQLPAVEELLGQTQSRPGATPRRSRSPSARP